MYDIASRSCVENALPLSHWHGPCCDADADCACDPASNSDPVGALPMLAGLAGLLRALAVPAPAYRGVAGADGAWGGTCGAGLYACRSVAAYTGADNLIRADPAAWPGPCCDPAPDCACTGAGVEARADSLKLKNKDLILKA